MCGFYVLCFLKLYLLGGTNLLLELLKTLFFGKYVGSDEMGNKYYQSKKNERWVVYSRNIEATKLHLIGFMDTPYDR